MVTTASLVVIKTGSYCKLLHGSCAVDAEMAAFLSELNVFFIERRAKKTPKEQTNKQKNRPNAKQAKERPKTPIAPIGSHGLYELAQLGAKKYE